MELLKITCILLQLICLNCLFVVGDSTGDDDDDAEISVPRSPKIIGPTEVNMTYPYGTTGPLESLICTFEGSPTPTVVWLKNSKLISEKEADYSIKFDDEKVQGRLEINSYVPERNGTDLHDHHVDVYTCIGLNFLGRSAKTFVLSFSPPPPTSKELTNNLNSITSAFK